MRDRCHTPEELADLSALPDGDPGRRHLAGCPRCQALLVSLEDFLEPRNLPAGADLPDARTRLTAARASGIKGSDAVDREPAGLVLRPVFRRWSPFRMRALAAVAAVLVLAASLALLRGAADNPRGTPVLRGAGTAEVVFSGAAAPLPGGGYRLGWPALPDAETYQVLIFDQGLVEIARFDTADATRLDLDPADLPAEPGLVFWRVVARRSGDEIARSEPAYFPAP